MPAVSPNVYGGADRLHQLHPPIWNSLDTHQPNRRFDAGVLLADGAFIFILFVTSGFQ